VAGGSWIVIGGMAFFWGCMFWISFDCLNLSSRDPIFFPSDYVIDPKISDFLAASYGV
jgi:hypothetical protein